jgi:hypothetical protein
MKGLHWLAALAVCGSLLVAAVPANAEPVAFAGKILFHIKAKAGGKTPAERVAEVEKRLIDIFAETKIVDEDVVIVKKGDERQILVKKHLLVTVTKEDAAFYKWPIDKVAKHWQKSILKNIKSMHLLPEQVGPSKKSK